MPIYEYKCKDCLTKFEIRATFEAFLNLKPVCPSCHGNKIKKLISIPNVQFKGHGFYVNDNTDKDGK